MQMHHGKRHMHASASASTIQGFVKFWSYRIKYDPCNYQFCVLFENLPPPLFCLIFLVVDCGNLTDPDNGQVTLSNGASLNSEASYSCNIGFAINGTSTRTCQINDQWSGSAPTCESENIVCIVAHCVEFTGDSQIYKYESLQRQEYQSHIYLIADRCFCPSQALSQPA